MRLLTRIRDWWNREPVDLDARDWDRRRWERNV